MKWGKKGHRKVKHNLWPVFEKYPHNYWGKVFASHTNNNSLESEIESKYSASMSQISLQYIGKEMGRKEMEAE